jgi:sugar phosphate isomerase/epimerase
MYAIPLAVQLYTLRDLIAEDFVSTVQQVAGMGYAGVELAGYGNLKSASEVKRVLDDLGLMVSGSHAGIESLEDDLGAVLDDQAVLGNRHLICPWMPEARRKDADGWKAVAASLNRIGNSCSARGIDFAYHNHAFEFQQFEGKAGLDILFENSDPNFVKAELDVYWIQHAGVDPVAYISKLGQRTILLHLKDMAAGDEKRFAPVGTGILNFNGILKAAQTAGVRWGVVEQDKTYDTPPLNAIRTSLENLRQIRIG